MSFCRLLDLVPIFEKSIILRSNQQPKSFKRIGANTTRSKLNWLGKRNHLLEYETTLVKSIREDSFEYLLATKLVRDVKNVGQGLVLFSIQSGRYTLPFFDLAGRQTNLFSFREKTEYQIRCFFFSKEKEIWKLSNTVLTIYFWSKAITRLQRLFDPAEWRQDLRTRCTYWNCVKKVSWYTSIGVGRSNNWRVHTRNWGTRRKSCSYLLNHSLYVEKYILFRTSYCVWSIQWGKTITNVKLSSRSFVRSSVCSI